MSSNKKRKSDVNIDSVGLAQPKKEKWFDAEQAKNLLSAPLADAPSAGRRSSFIGALKRMVSGSALRDKTRSMSKLHNVSLRSDPPASTSFKENSSFRENSFKENSFKETSELSYASETSQESQESEHQIPVEQIVRNHHLAKFVRQSEATEFTESSMETGSMDSLNSSMSSGSVFATPSRGIRRDEKRSSVRSMPESHLVEGLCLSAVRRNASSLSDGGPTQSPLSKCRKSFRMLRKLSSSMAELPENSELNTSFAPLAEMDEDCLDSAVTPVADSMLASTRTESTKKVKRTGSRLFGRKRNSLSTPNGENNVSFSTTGEGPSTPASGLNRATPSSSNIHRKVSSALTKIGLMQSNTPTGPSAVVLKRTRTDKSASRPDVSRRNSIATGFGTATCNEAADKAKQEANLFRKQVRLAELPIPEVVDSMQFDAIIVDCLVNGQPASDAAKSLINEEDAKALHRAVMLDPSKQQVIYHRKGNDTEVKKPTLICIKMDSPSTQPIDKRVRVGVGSGLREAFALEGVSRVLAYPMFCMSEEEWNDEEKCLDQLLTMVMHALSWNANPDKIEYVVLAGLSADHAKLLRERYDAFMAQLPSEEEPKQKEEEGIAIETDL